ncbi:MAG: hypothetical protein EOP51_23250, partial [Sphingobacteriales bacterium]
MKYILCATQQKFAFVIVLSVTILTAGCKKTSVDKANAHKVNPKETAAKVAYIDTNITKFFKRKTGWIASDGGTTVNLSNGHVLWLFGDTYFNGYRESDGTLPCLFSTRSTAMLQPYNVWAPEKTRSFGPPPGDNSLFRSNKANGYWNWPAHGLQLGDTVYIYAPLYKHVQGGLGFDTGGNDVMAKMAGNNPYVVGYHQLQDFNKISFLQARKKL